MSAVIGALRAELSASIAKFKDDMGKAADEVAKFASSVEKQGARIESAGKKLSLALTVPLVAFGYKAVEAGKQAAQAMGQVEAALTSTGGRSGRTAEQLQQSAAALEQISTFDKTDILAGVSASLLRFGNIQGPIFDEAQKAVVNLATRLGMDLPNAAKLVGKALNQPATGLTALNRAGVQFTKSQKDMVASLIATGRGLDAQKLILAELDREFGGAAEAARKNDPFAVLNNSLRDLAETAGPLIVAAITPITEALKGLADWFDTLSPTMQKVVVYAGLFAAALGPVLVVIGNVTKVIGFITPLIYGLGEAIAAAIGISLGALLGWVVAIGAAVGAVVLFWKSIKDILHGDFTAAWADAKEAAGKLVDDVTGLFEKKPAKMPVVIVPPKADSGGAGKQQFDLPAQVESARKAFEASLKGIDIKIANGIDTLQLPKAVAAANELTAQIDEAVRKAKEAGVNTGAWSAQIDRLRANVEKLKQVGLAKEAEKFGREVDANGIAVERFAKGSLDPLSEKLEGVDTAYKSLKDKIDAQIKDNTVLAQSNDAAAAAMAKLQGQLGDLEKAHALATQAAKDQWAAENKLRDLEAQGANLETTQQIRDFKQSSTVTGPISSHQEALQKSSDDLQKTQIETATKLQDLENQRAEAARVGDDEQVKRLDGQIELQKQFYDLVQHTTADQIDAATRINGAFKSFTDDLASSLTDMISNWSFDLNGLRNVFKDLAKELFIKPFVTSAAEGLTGSLKGLFSSASSGSGSGGFGDLFSGFLGGKAGGGYVGPNEWAIAGEHGPEPVFGGKQGVTVMSNPDATAAFGAGGSRTVVQNFNISTPDANSFRMSQRQIGRSAKQKLAVG